MRKKKQFELFYANSFEELKSKLDYFQEKLNLEGNFIESVIIRSIVGNGNLLLDLRGGKNGGVKGENIAS